jgi:hypothetical protein
MNQPNQLAVAAATRSAIKEIQQHLVTESEEVALAYEDFNPAEDDTALLWMHQNAKSMFVRGVVAGLLLAKR